MAYVARTHLSAGDAPSLNDYNQGMDNEAQLKAWVDQSDKASLTNKSGGDLLLGAVVIFDEDNDSSFKTTTLVGDRRCMGVLWEDIDNNGTGLVVVGRRKTSALVQGNVTRGNWLRTSATAGRAEDGGPTWFVGAIGYALTSYSGGGAGSVEAMLMPDTSLTRAGGSVYCAGGYTTTAVPTTNKMPASTETFSVVAGAALSAARSLVAGLSQPSTKGLALGGYSSGTTAVATADRLTFATDVTAAVSSANLSAARAKAGGASGSDRGLSGSGHTGAADSLINDRTYWATEATAASGSAAFDLAASARCGLQSDADGYWLGLLVNTTANNSLRKVPFSSEIRSNLSGTMSSSRGGAAGACSATNAYAAGGRNGTTSYTTTDKMPFSSETPAAQGSAATTVNRCNACGVHLALNGYFVGGSNGYILTNDEAGTSGTQLLSTDKLVFGTDTTSALSGGSIATATFGMAGMRSSV